MSIARRAFAALGALIDRLARRLYRPDSALVAALEELFEQPTLDPDDTAREGKP